MLVPDRFMSKWYYGSVGTVLCVLRAVYHDYDENCLIWIVKYHFNVYISINVFIHLPPLIAIIYVPNRVDSKYWRC